MPYRILASSILIIFLSTTWSLAERVALVIGNSEYERAQRLSNPVNDAMDVGASLERIGFEVTTLLNANRNELNQSLSAFARNARGSEMAVVYFAGHGMEIDNSNYLLPVDADIQDPLDVAFEGIEMSQFLRVVEGAETLKLVLLDACRDNPFLAIASGGTRSLRRGLARIEPPGGVLVGYAARGGTVAYDGEGRNSPYASALLQNLERPGLEIGKFFRIVRDQVFKDTRGKQEPFTYGSLPAKDIYLVAAPLQGTSELFDSSVISPTNDPEEQESQLGLGITEKRNVQIMLDSLGHRPGQPDGVFGANTRQAIEDFQQEIGFPETGYLSGALVSQLIVKFKEAPVTLNGRWRLNLERKTIKVRPSFNDSVGLVSTMGFVELTIIGNRIIVERSMNLSNAPNPKEPELRATLVQGERIELSAMINYEFFKDDHRRVFSAIRLSERVPVGKELTAEGTILNEYYQFHAKLKRISAD